MTEDVLVVGMVCGLPIAGWIVISLIKEAHNWSLKTRELKLREQQAVLDERRHSDEINAKILRMDDYGISPAEVAQLAVEVRQLREEVARMRQDVDSRTTG